MFLCSVCVTPMFLGSIVSLCLSLSLKMVPEYVGTGFYFVILARVVHSLPWICLLLLYVMPSVSSCVFSILTKRVHYNSALKLICLLTLVRQELY